MIKQIRKQFYRLSVSPKAKVAGISLIILIGLQSTNELLFQLLSLKQTAWPWSFLSVIQYGFITSTLLAFFSVLLPMAAIALWCSGGVKRAIAQHIFLFFILFIMLSTLGLYVFIMWDDVAIQAYPWLIYPLLNQLPSGSEVYKHLLISLMGSYSLLFVLLVSKCFSYKIKAEKVFGNAHFSNAFEIKHAGLFAESGIVLGNAYGKRLRLPGHEGVLVVAPTGSGKTTAIAIPNLLEWNGSGVFNDLKGELYHLTGEYRRRVLKNTCHVWAPADSTQKTARYNPFFYVSANPDLRIRDLQLIAETLIPATRLGDGFWYQSSREIFLTLSLYLFETKGKATLSEVHDLSKQGDFFEWLMNELLEKRDIFSKCLKQNSYAILSADKRTQRNILKDFHSRMGLFADPLVGFATSANDFDFHDLRRKKMSLYINIPDSDKERLSPILTLFWSQLINVMSAHEPKSDEPYGVLALMEEFGNMARINKLKEGMSFLRSYHVRPIIIVQYLAQIVSVYGREDSKGFLNAKVKIAFALNDLDDAHFFSRSLGAKTVRVSSSSVSTGHGDNPGSQSENLNYQSRSLMSPDELMKLSGKKAVILIESRNPIKANKCYWFKEAKYQLF